MCMMVMPLLSFALGAAQAVMGYQAQQQAADRQNQMYYQNAMQANEALRNQYAATQTQRLQEREAADQKDTEGAITALRARSTAFNAAGEAGVTGLSVDALMADYTGREARNREAVDENYQMESSHLDADMKSQYAGAQSRINSVQRATPPSFADALIRIGSAGLGAMTMNSRMNNPYAGGYGYSNGMAMDFNG